MSCKLENSLGRIGGKFMQASRRLQRYQVEAGMKTTSPYNG
jgi:hypothetical protein